MPRKGGVPKNLKSYPKGVSGNPKGRPPKLPELEVLMAKVMGEEKGGITAMEAVIAALRAKAAKGDVRAAEVLLNRGYGLPKQSLDINGNINNTLTINVTSKKPNT